MFSFRRDKTGFFAGLTLMTVAGGTAIATLVLVIVGWAIGNRTVYDFSVRWVLGIAWVLCIATVLTRIYIFRWQMKRRERAAAAAQAANEPAPPDANGAPPDAPTAPTQKGGELPTSSPGTPP
jgi:hypothetical protein